jgi:hypothetical protein
MSFLRFRLADLFLLVTVSAVACGLTQLPNTSLFDTGPIVAFCLAAWLTASLSLVPGVSCRFIAMAWIWAASNALRQFELTFHLLACSSRLNSWEEDLAEYVWPCVLRDAILVSALSLPALLIVSSGSKKRENLAPAIAMLGAILAVGAAMAFSYWLCTWEW